MFKLLTEAQLGTVKAGFDVGQHESHMYSDDNCLETWVSRGRCHNWFIVEIHKIANDKITVIIDVAFGRIGYLRNDVYMTSAKDMLATPQFIILDQHVYNLPKYLWQ